MLVFPAEAEEPLEWIFREEKTIRMSFAQPLQEVLSIVFERS